MEPLSPLSFSLLHSPFWGLPYAICYLALVVVCWAGCHHLAQEIFKTKPTKFIAWLALLSMCVIVGVTNSVTPTRMKDAIAHSDLRELLWDWKRGDRVAVEKWLSDPKIQKYYASDDD